MVIPEHRVNQFNLPPVPDEESVDLWQIVTDLWSARWLILVGTLRAALVAAGVSMNLPKVFEATATIFVTPATFSSPLKSPPFSVEAYGRLAESDYILNLVQDQLRAAKVIGPNEGVSRIRTELYASRGDTPYLPLFGIIAHATSADRAQLIANTWATTFVDEQTKLAEARTAGTVNFIVTEFPKATQALADVEREMEALQEKQGAEIADMALRSNIELKRSSVSTQESYVFRLESQLTSIRLDLLRARQRLAHLEPELQRTPQFTVLSKAISDDALWQRLGAATTNGSADKALFGELTQQRLQTQEVNPVHQDLARQVAEVRVDVNSLGPLEITMTKELQSARVTLDQMRQDLVASEMREADMLREHQIERTRLQRRIDEATARFKPISDRIGEAEIARVQTAPDLRVGALASLPAGPIGPNIPMNIAAAAAGGFLLSVFGAWIVKRAR